jgi:hypothetical protein
VVKRSSQRLDITHGAVLSDGDFEIDGANGRPRRHERSSLTGH